MLSTKYYLKYGSKTIGYNLSFSKRKTLGIKVVPDGSVFVKAPIGSSIEDIAHKLKFKGHWILKQQIFFDLYRPFKPKREFVNGETHLYLGRQYKLEIQIADSNTVKILRGCIIVSTPNSSQANIELILNDWYRAKAIPLFEDLFVKANDIIKKDMVIKPSISIRRMQKRWGSCNAKGQIILNPELVKASKGSILYVILHELCHLVHFNHSKDFYKLQNELMPDWAIWKERLEVLMA